MNNILKQAKEIEKGCGKRKWNSSNNERGKVGGYICGKRMLCQECVDKLKEEATELLKKAREGCGVEMKTNHGKLICGKQELFVEGEFKKLCCLKCQEAIKILECVISGNQEGRKE